MNAELTGAVRLLGRVELPDAGCPGVAGNVAGSVRCNRLAGRPPIWRIWRPVRRHIKQGGEERRENDERSK